MSDAAQDFDDVVESIDAGLAQLKGLSRRLSALPRSSDAFRDVVASLAKLEPEPGYDLLKNAAIGVHLVGPTGTVLWANQCELESLGYTPDEYFGRSITEFHMDADVIAHILKTLTEGRKLSAFPARLRAVDGSVVYVLINSNVYSDKDGFAHTRCFTVRVPEEVYAARRCCDLEGCPHK